MRPIVSIVIPSMDEEETIRGCIKTAFSTLETLNLSGEIIVADSSTDSTPEIARNFGARVVSPEKKGYGYAYFAGLALAQGKYIVIADADGTYDLSTIPQFLKPLMEDTADFVIGTRLKGDIKKGAMTWLHRYVGNPVLTKILNFLFKTKISDAHCGMRAFTKDALKKLNLKTGGMEFSSEMIIEAARKKLRITEIPIPYYPRTGAPSKLHSFGDGWRHLRFMMIYNPTPFFFVPGAIGLTIGSAITMKLSQIKGVETSHLHSLILGAILSLIGIQSILTGAYVRAYGIISGKTEKSGITGRLLDYHSLEMGLILGLALFVAGVILGLMVLYKWIYSGYGSLSEVGNAVLAMVLAAIGINIMLSSIFFSMLILDRNEDRE